MESANNTKQTKLTLKERYNDEFLEKAECRRKALQYIKNACRTNKYRQIGTYDKTS